MLPGMKLLLMRHRLQHLHVDPTHAAGNTASRNAGANMQGAMTILLPHPCMR